MGLNLSRTARNISMVRYLCSFVLSTLVSCLASVAKAEETPTPPAPARIDELEAQVRALLKRQVQQQAQIEQLETTRTRVEEDTQKPTPETKPVPLNSLQTTSLLPGATPGTTLRFGGFIKVDFLASKTSDGQLPDGDIGRAAYLPWSIPVGGKSSGVDYDSHAKFSRFHLGADHVSGDQRIGGYIEIDFFGNLSSQVSQNSYGLTLRHVYLYWNDWLVGQTWSNFMDLTAIPETVDFIGPGDAALFARQAQLRYRRGGLSIALENPETTLTLDRATSDRGAWPDLTARYGWSGAWGTFGVAGLLREVKVNTADYSDSRMGWGLTLGGRLQFSSRDMLCYQLSGGVGISRYVGISINGDASLDPDTGNLHLTGMVAGYAGFRHEFTNTLRTNIVYSRSDYDNDRRFSGPNATMYVHSGRVNLIYSPAPKLDVGVELSYARRKAESGDEGDLSRVHGTVKYTF